jgi:hypothetical protein
MQQQQSGISATKSTAKATPSYGCVYIQVQVQLLCKHKQSCVLQFCIPNPE